MQALQNQRLLSSDMTAMDQLQRFLRRRQAAEPVEDFDQVEQEPIEFTIAQQHHPDAVHNPLGNPLDPLDGHRFGNMISRSLAHAPGQWQSPSLIDHGNHRPGVPARK